MKHGKGMLAAALYANAVELMVQIFLYFVNNFSAESTAKWCDGGSCFVELWCLRYYFLLLAPAVVLSIFTGRQWPKRKRNMPAAMLLSQLMGLTLFHGSFLAVKLYAVIESTLLAQIVIEVLLLFVYLWARVLARRAFCGDPSLESRSLFAYLLISDVFAELAFINVPFMSGQFLVLVTVDFVMLLARDADL